MNLTNYYWYFQSAIPHRICDDISKYGKQPQEQMAVTGGYGDKKLNQKQNTPNTCLLYTSPSPRDGLLSRMPSSA